MIYFTSDTHWRHLNSIKYCNRPYDSTEQMDQALIDNWNSVVKPNDDVYHLGDFSFCNQQDTKAIIQQLSGNIHLVLGNHDKGMKSLKNEFNWVKDYYELKVKDPDVNGGNQLIILSHYPFRTWNKKHYGTWSLHGHCHGNLEDQGDDLILDVGVDCFNYTPVSYEEIKEIMKEKINKEKNRTTETD